MAEGLVNALLNGKYKAYSAGTEPSRVNPYAIKALAELGIDISTHYSKSVEEFRGKTFHTIVTVCENTTLGRKRTMAAARWKLPD